jgi:lipopolysaccharide transport system ATP-binding protein
MNSGNVSISIRGVSKAYHVAHDVVRHSTLAETILDKLRHPLRRPPTETFWALRDIEFDVEAGDVVGIIGRNGAGKSTLLKILSRITEPTRGEIDVYGRVGSLLEVGTGFHPELTGRENIFLNGTILGMRRREVARQFDAIVDFAGIEKFLDTPVKRYSSGMYVRLAFAVAAHLNPEIMIVDEVLAVGDAEFQSRCLGKMKDVSTSGRTVLFVSHNMQAVSLLCNRGILLQGGRVAFQGNVQGAVDQYLNSFTGCDADGAGGDEDPDRRRGSGEYRFRSAAPGKSIFAGDEEKDVHFVIERRRGAPRVGRPLHLSAHVVNPLGVVVAQLDSRLVGHTVAERDSLEGTLRFRSPWLKPGHYRIDLYICAANYGIIDHYESACGMHVSPVLPYRHAVSKDGIDAGLVFSDFDWTVGPRKRAPHFELAPTAT